MKAVVLLVALAACGGEAPAAPSTSSVGVADGERLTERATVRLNPLDLSTSTGSTMPELVIDDDSDSLSPDEQRAWTDRVRIFDLRTGRTIEAETIYDPPSAPERGIHEHRFIYQPATPLEAGWYAIEVDLGDVRESRAQQGLYERASGRYWARFRVDSHPLVTSVVARDEDEYTRLELELSERVRLADDAVEVRVGGERVECRLIRTATTDIAGRDTVEDTELTVTLRCASAIEESVEVSFADSVTTLDDEPLHGLDDTTPARLSWDPAAMTEVRSEHRVRELRLEPRMEIGAL